MSRESQAAEGQYGGSSSSASNASSGGFGGGRDASQPDFSPPSAGGRNDNKDPTKQYENLPKDYNLEKDNPDAYKALTEQRKQAQYAISPMTDPKNKAIAAGLSLLFGTPAGSAYARYKNATALGYDLTLENFLGFNPFGDNNNFPSINTGGDGEGLIGTSGENRALQTQIVSKAPFILTQSEEIPSVVNEYFANANMGQQLSSDLQTRYNSAKSNINNILNIQSVEDQYGFVRQPNLLNLNLTGLI